MTRPSPNAASEVDLVQKHVGMFWFFLPSLLLNSLMSSFTLQYEPFVLQFIRVVVIPLKKYFVGS